MGFGIGIILTAVGAILAWAVHTNTSSVNVNTVGYILLAVGLASILLSVVFWSSWAGPGYFSRTRERTVDESGRTSVTDRVTS
ncbi:MAG: DUF6458 family protein [Gaiellaceae bacterium]